MPQHQRLIAVGAILAMLGVAAGAFGAHAMRNTVGPDLLSIWNTGVQYHLYHALGVIITGLIARVYPGSRGIAWAGWLIITGVFIFSGSLYALTLTGIRTLGAITPIGGAALILGWLILAVSIFRYRK